MTNVPNPPPLPGVHAPAPSIIITLASGQRYAAADWDQASAWAREGRIPPDAIIAEAGKEPIHARRHPVLAGLVINRNLPPPDDGPVSSVIPYRNMPALMGYYTSIAALIPIVGFIAGPLAMGLGITGFKKARSEPRAKGTAHAIVAITLGALSTLAHYGIIAFLILKNLKWI